MFSAGLNGSRTPCSAAVAGMSCISPIAPFDDTARGLNADSAWISARTRSGLTTFLAACSSIRSLYSVARVLKGLVVRNVAGAVDIA
jgi:hypothetical protein